MKLAYYFFFLLLLCSLQKQQFKLWVYVTGMKTEKGKINIAIYRESDTFPDKGKQFIGKIIASDSDITYIEFDNLPPGSYAVAAFHDENGNGKMDKNKLGIPVERYGFSNNARGVFSAPSFHDASFLIHEDRSIRVSLK